jgi:murein DD-endopeptidase MepM/ murein hydrolase activator NlpD
MAVKITTIIAPEPGSGSKVLFSGAQPRVANLTSSTSTAEVRKVAEEFASLLMLEMLKSMRATLSQEGLDGDKSSARDTYASLADVEVTRALAKHDKMGLTAFLERALSRTAAKTEAPATVSAPSVGEVSSRFGPRSDPLVGEERFHNGIDIAAPEGSPVKAVEAGTVVFSGAANGYGNLVEIDHGNGVVTRYAHTQGNLVSVGQQVEAGQTIARVGETGRATGPHLHFEVHQNGTPVDPQLFLQRIRS